MAVLGACRGAAPPPTPSACALGVSAGTAADTLTIAASGTINRRRPHARTDAERILFRQLYEPLIEVGCDGAVRPGLASAWRPSDGGRTWVFTLRAGAHFWDGVPVTARDVAASWRAQDTAGVLAPWAGPVRNAVIAADDTTVVVRLDTVYATVPHAFAEPGLAVAKRVAGLQAPLGTGSYWLDAAALTPTASPLPGRSGPVLVFDHIDRDARDALDAGVAVVVTDDPGTIAYAAQRPELTSLPLPWHQTYVLLRPWFGGAAPDGAALAHDVVRVEARGAELPGWWNEAAPCGDRAAGGEPMARPLAPPVAYSRDDVEARRLAERLVAVSGDRRRAVGYGAAAFATLLRDASESEAVLALPREALDPCLARRRLRAQGVVGHVLPLVRRRLIVRGPVSGVYVDWDGVPRWR
jgi:hypothetical protein